MPSSAMIVFVVATAAADFSSLTHDPYPEPERGPSSCMELYAPMEVELSLAHEPYTPPPPSVSSLR